MERCVFYINGRESNSKLSSSCQISLTGSQISIWSGGQSSSGRITCFYTVNKTQVQKPSPHSDPVTITIKQNDTTATKTSDPYSKSNLPTSTTKETMISTKAAHATTAMTTYLLSTSKLQTTTTKETTPMPTQKTSQMDKKIKMTAVSTTETPTLTSRDIPNVHTSTVHTESPTTTQHPQNKDTWLIVLVSSGVGVILSGLICLWFVCKKRQQRNKIRSIKSDVPSQGIGMSSGPAETYSLITSVPTTSQPISVESHQDSTPDPTATSSLIMSENSLYQPSGVLVNKQQKKGNTKKNENVYHMYCTIPDKPVHSNAEDQVYSLVL
ncbi:protein let-653-like isoform X2 [Pseudorasbora parva]|uniref:protein let-653-like isoform X2 n=1 Tax=Pseudorasbora parva TaxID=51549 RepID=UPI00351EE1C1